MAEFNFLENLPLIVFTLAFFIIFVIFLFGGFVLLTAGRDVYRIEKGRKVLLNSLYALFIVLLIALVFFSVTYLLKKGEVLLPQETPGEFPSSPAANFPPPPQFIKIEKYYFIGPRLLKDNNLIKDSAVYAIFCKRNEEYDIIYVGETERREQLLKHVEYRCWLENCNQEFKDLYIGVFEAPSEIYNSADRKGIRKELINELNPSCSPSELNNE